MVIETLIKPNVYFDSLVLMHLSSSLLKQPGVSKAVVMMGTDENRATVKDKELLTEAVLKATPNDLFIVIAAESESAARAAIARAVDYLENKRSEDGREALCYKTLDAAIQNTPGANLVSISLPGKYAGAEARRALEAGLHVFLFSDNVPLQEELNLKQLAMSKKRLLMGPDCGTAILGGAALGFANAVRKGPIGVVGASGTGIQEVTTLIHRLGAGISHAIGTGTRDVSPDVNGATLVAGLEWMACDPQTSVILIVSKPPSPSAKEKVLEIVRRVDKPVVVNLLGSGAKDYQTENTYLAETMEDAALISVWLARGGAPESLRSTLYQEDELKRLAAAEHSRLKPSQVYYRGLFSGGTFANEAAMLLKNSLDEVYGNISLPGILPLADAFASFKHTCVDMGDDIFTVGKPHPILAPALRRERILAEAADPSTAVIYLDVVLGFGGHPDPATEFAEFISEAKALAAKDGRHLPVIAYVAGVDEDPQNFTAQVETLRQSGALVAPTNAAATRLALGILSGHYPEAGSLALHPFNRPASSLETEPPFDLPERANVINIGLSAFAESLEQQQVPVTHVDFHPPAGGNEAMAKLLADML